MASATERFENLSRSRFDELKAKASTLGVEIDTDRGEVSRGAIKVVWKYDESNQVLEIGCTSTSWLVPSSVLKRKIQELVISL